ncbi:SDR family NAD(P)-dependent oxidoreductase [Mycolicibacterium sp. 120266]|uniref:SDR family NAD(P)-dependent oxidoreductase n=1 Tax=Mycolicibacterium sp. 120266 TaxID=3090601 RepID=UPI0039A54A3A
MRSTSPRVVNVSSAMGSIALITDPQIEVTKLNQAAYQTSKAALNALTVLYANELRPDGVKVNAVCPGYRATQRWTAHPGCRRPCRRSNSSRGHGPHRQRWTDRTVHR